ncbi:MAG: PEP-CTERM sorting domain-containing protein [Deltaproteobacteria bacterium]|nr:MAG: PEP-CTERM sorting domain-containing protein [Deltaproteobacteria bacterium]
MNSGTAVFRMLGEEKRRTYVPEPGATEMITAGGLGLALLGWRRKRSTCG